MADLQDVSLPFAHPKFLLYFGFGIIIFFSFHPKLLYKVQQRMAACFHAPPCKWLHFTDGGSNSPAPVCKICTVLQDGWMKGASEYQLLGLSPRMDLCSDSLF